MFCEDCKGKKFLAVVGVGECGHSTSSGQHRFCRRCAFAKSVCIACGTHVTRETAESDT